MIACRVETGGEPIGNRLKKETGRSRGVTRPKETPFGSSLLSVHADTLLVIL